MTRYEYRVDPEIKLDSGLARLSGILLLGNKTRPAMLDSYLNSLGESGWHPVRVAGQTVFERIVS